MPECFCERDADGQCRSCQDTLARTTTSVVQLEVKLMRDLDEVRGGAGPVCNDCAMRYADVSIAALVAKVFPELPKPEMASNLFYNFVLPMLHEMGAASDVLTTKAYRDFCAQRGWSA